jgi:nucleolar complex protein 2
VERVRIVCFLALRKLALCREETLTLQVYKAAYVSFLAVAKTTSVYSAGLIHFMSNCLVELFGVDASLTYQHAFMSIRQIAIHLRTAVTQHNDANHRQVYQWSVVHALKLWCRVIGALSAHDAQASLKALVFPVVQIALGIIKLLPSSQYHPLRLHVMRALVDLARRTNTFIPLTPHLLDIYQDMAVMSEKTKPSTVKPLDFATMIRVPKPHANTRVYLDGLLDETNEVAVEYMAHVSNWIAFPEIILVMAVHLKKIQKASKYGKLAKSISGLLEKMERNRQQVLKARTQMTSTPLDSDRIPVCSGLDVAETALGRYLADIKRTKEQQRRLMANSNKK